MRQFGAMVAMVLVLGIAGSASQGRPTDGRWVMVGVPIAYVFSGDSVSMVMYPPQAPLMTYHVRDDSVETGAAGSRRVQAFSIRGDTLRLSAGTKVAAYRRMGSPVAMGSRLLGTWHSVDGNPVSVLTFRADDQLIPEVQAPTQMRLHGDTLESIAGGQSYRVVLHRMADTITLVPSAGIALPTGSQAQRIVRRPWGCFGMPDVDRAAVECR